MDGEHLCEDPASDSDGPKNEASKRTKIPFRSKVTLAVLVFINLLNYMDRYTIASKFVHNIFLPCSHCKRKILTKYSELRKGEC